MTDSPIRKIVITGGAGYIGNTLIKSLPETVDVIVIDNFHIDTEHKREINAKLTRTRNVTIVEANVSQVEKYEAYLKDVDAVIYMASLNVYKESNENPLLYLKENAENVQIFIDVLKKHSPHVKKMIVTSSRGVYGEGSYICNTCHKRCFPLLSEILICTFCQSSNLKPQKLIESDIPNPSSMYGLTKRLQEDILSLYAVQTNTPLDIIRIFNVFGHDQGKYYASIGIVPRIFEQITTKKELSLSGNGNLTRDFVSVDDVVTVLQAAVFSEDTRENLIETYNLGSGVATRIKDIADFFETIGYTFTRHNLAAYGDIQYSVADTTKVQKTFGIATFTNVMDFMKETYAKNN